MKMIFQNVRCSYVFIREPRASEDGKPGKYSLQILLPKDDGQVAKAKKTIEAVAKEQFGGDIKMSMLKTPLRDGDTDRDSPEYDGHYFINANTARKPQIVNKRNEPADQDDLDEGCYSGCYFHASVNFYAFNFEGKKGVAAGLSNVMMRKKGDRLDGTTEATSEFSEYAEEGTDDGDEW